MADSTTWVLVGLGIGVGVGLGVALLIDRRRSGGGTPGLTVHDVIRDDRGRIETVETVQGIGSTALVEQHAR